MCGGVGVRITEELVFGVPEICLVLTVILGLSLYSDLCVWC